MKKIFTLIAVLTATLSINATDIFSFKLASDVPDLTITGSGDESFTSTASSSTVVTTAHYTITAGAELLIHNGHADAKKYISGGYITLGGSGKSYVQVNLSTGVTLKEGDVIKLVEGTKGGGAVVAEEASVSADNMDSNNEYTVGADLAGKSSFLIYRGATKPTFKGVTVERNEGQTIAPVISVADGKVVMTCGTEGASIYYATATGVTPSTGTLYSAPIAITSSVTYYAVAVKEGLEVSKESSKAVEYYTIPATATLDATLKAPSTIAQGNDDEALESLTDGTFTATKKESDAVLSNTAPFGNAIQNLVKVKKTIIIKTTGDKNIVGIKVKGISNSDGTQAVTATGMKFTTDGNLLPARGTEANPTKEPGVVELVAETPAKEFEVYFSGQARVLFEVYTGEGTGIQNVKAVEVTDGVIYNLAGQKVDNNYKGIVIKDGAKYIQK